MTDTTAGHWVPISEAVGHFDRSERSLRRWVKSGKLRGKLEDGRLFVFIAAPVDNVTDKPPAVEALQKEIDNLTTLNDILSSQLTDTKNERDQWREEAEAWKRQAGALTAMMNSQQKQLEAMTTDQDPRPWYKRLFNIG